MMGKHHSPMPPILRVCKSCGVDFTISAAIARFYEKKGLNRGVFCSLKCKGVARLGVINQSVIDANSIPEPNSGCWLWLGAKHQKFGYGKIGYDNRKYQAAHRASYSVFNGEIPDGMLVRHKCDNPYCVNPDHLEVGTDADNMADMVRRGRSLKGGKNHNAVLNDTVVSDIKRRLFLGSNQKTIAAEFGVWGSAIQKIQTGNSWRHVPWPIESGIGADGLHLPANSRRGYTRKSAAA
jgi:hypothetical protein